MLSELRIKDVGVIAEASIELGEGFTAITGETGAGKTMVVTGLALLLGARAEPRLIRIGSPRAIVEGRFHVDEAISAAAQVHGGEIEDGELLVTRHIAASRSRAYVGGASVPIGTAAGLLSEWVTLHGQSEQMRLATPQRQREVLDQHAGPKLHAALDTYTTLFTERAHAEAEREQLVTEAQQRLQETDLLRFGLAEIAKVAPVSGEDVALTSEAQRLQSIDELRLSVATAVTALTGTDSDLDASDATGLVSRARTELETAQAHDETLTEPSQRLASVGYELADIAQTLASYLADLDADPQRLDWISARRAELLTLTRKYGANIAEVLSWAHTATLRIDELTHDESRIDDLGNRITELTHTLTELAGTITAERTRAARELETAVKAELTALAMPHAVVTFDITTTEQLGPHGVDDIRLLFAANPGSVPGPMGKIASGGELSRVRLALEVVLATDTPGHVFIFDEVDAGVGGTTALEIGRRLRRLAQHSQVIVVTHLAQVAAFADHHFVVSKSDTGDVTTSGIVGVTGSHRLDELARMMGGEATEAARARAAELLQLGSR